MNNAQIADTLDRLADLLEFQGANAFRTRAYRTGARNIRGISQSIAQLVRDEANLVEIDGIGKSVADKCVTLVQTGSLPQLEELLQQIPASVLDILRIPGLGPKKAALLYQQLGIETLEQLQQACEQQQVRQLKGFAAKTEAAILAGISFAATASERMFWAKADELATEIRGHMQQSAATDRIELAGSYRRGKETVGDIDILVQSDDAETVMQHLADFSRLDSVILRGDNKMSIRIEGQWQIDLRVLPSESFGAALQYFTGSKEHNVELRRRANKLGLKINEYGVFRIDDESYVAGSTEEDVYQAVQLPWIPPELREGRREFAWAESKQGLPRLIELPDIQGDLHMHTTATDGKASIQEMAEAARSIGLNYIAITDHSKRVSMANGLDAPRLRKHWKAVDAVNLAYGDDFTLLKGIECDILEAGGMDLPDDVLAEADWVLASIHYGQKQPSQQITDRMLAAIEHPHVHAIAHPTGRLINSRPAYDVDREAVFLAAKRCGKMLELNANPARLDLNDIDCAAAKQHGIPIVINTDAHSVNGLNVMRFGILQARRAGLTAHDVANTSTWSDLKKRIGQPAPATPTD